VPKQYTDPIKAKAIEAMVEYGLTEGQKASEELGYVPLPQKVIAKVAAAADQLSPDYKIEVGSATSSSSPSASSSPKASGSSSPSSSPSTSSSPSPSK
jgi:hypothetical protein